MTLYTSDKTLMIKDARAFKGYLGFTVFCIFFSLIYEHFSHGVYSIYMTSLLAYPLILGLIPMMVRIVAKLRPMGETNRTVHMWAVVTLTIASCLKGVFEIYGTTSPFTIFFWIAGAAMLALSIGIYVRGYLK